MSYLLEILGQSLPDSLWPVFEESLRAEPVRSPSSQASVATAVRRCGDHVRAGVAALQSGSAGQARVHFDRAAALRDRSPAVIIGMACALDMLGQPQRALRYLRLASRQQPEDPRILYGLGLLEERCNRPEKARTCYRHSLYFQPHQKAARQRLMAIAFAEREFGAATQQAEALAAQFHLELPAWTRLGGLYLLTEQPARAAAAFEEALRLLADNWHSPGQEAGSPDHAGPFDDAIAEVKAAIADGGQHADLHVRLGDLYGRGGRSDEAIEEYREALRINPFYLEATAKLAAGYIRAGRRREGAMWLGRAIEINETLLATYVGLALAQACDRRRAETARTLEMARGIAYNGPVLMAEIARLHASVLGTAGPGLGPDADAQERALDRDELLSRAIQAHLAWLTHNDNDAGAWMRLGLLLEADKQLPYALEVYEKCVQICPTCAPAIARLGLARADGQELGKGLLRGAFWPDAVALHTYYDLALLFSQAQRFELTAEKFADVLPPDRQSCFWRNVSLSLEQMAMLNMPKCLWQSLCEMSGMEAGALAGGIGHGSPSGVDQPM